MAGFAAPVHIAAAPIESLDTQRREVSSAAFTFSESGHAAAARRADRARQPCRPARRPSHALAAGALDLPGLAQLTMWQLTGSLLLDGLRSWQPVAVPSTPSVPQRYISRCVAWRDRNVHRSHLVRDNRASTGSRRSFRLLLSATSGISGCAARLPQTSANLALAPSRWCCHRSHGRECRRRAVGAPTRSKHDEERGSA